PPTQAEEAVGFARLLDSPRVAIDALDGDIGAAGARPGGPGHPRSTSEVNDLVDGSRQLRNGGDDMLNKEKMQRTIKEPEGRTLAGARERRAFGKLPASLDIRGRQGSKRSRHFPEREIGKMTL